MRIKKGDYEPHEIVYVNHTGDGIVPVTIKEKTGDGLYTIIDSYGYDWYDFEVGYIFQTKQQAIDYFGGGE